MKVYIIPTGWDRELVIKTVFKAGVDKVCLISVYRKKDHNYSPADKVTEKVSDYCINISTGSHMVAAALMFVAYMNNIDLEYSVGENHNPKIMKMVEQGEDLHNGFSRIMKIPAIPFKLKFSTKEKKLLTKLKKKKVIDVKDFIDGAKGNMENRLRSEFHYICKKLEKQGFVKINNKGKKFEVSLTNFGDLCIED